MKRVLTGITTTGIPHLGNYIGAIKPSIAESNNDAIKSYFFLADYHALIKSHDPQLIRESSLKIAATWLALGLSDRSSFYRQSDIPEIFELTWILTCFTAKGLMNRAHAYKAAADLNIEDGNDVDKAITMGLYSYPILMSADILMFKANEVPVGKDQVQHVEMTRDIALRFNHNYGNILTIPEVVTNHSQETIIGLDGRKMSKSYNNIIPIFLEEKPLRKLINKIKTNSLEPGVPKEYKDCTLFALYAYFATSEEIESIKKLYAEGISWGDMKSILFDKIFNFFDPYRSTYTDYLSDEAFLEKRLRLGGEQAREEASAYLKEIKSAIGIK